MGPGNPPLGQSGPVRIPQRSTGAATPATHRERARSPGLQRRSGRRQRYQAVFKTVGALAQKPSGKLTGSGADQGERRQILGGQR